MGFVINTEKSVLTPSQTIVFLGGPMHYRHLEKEKITGLKYHKRNFEGKIRLSAKAIAETQW